MHMIWPPAVAVLLTKRNYRRFLICAATYGIGIRYLISPILLLDFWWNLGEGFQSYFILNNCLSMSRPDLQGLSAWAILESGKRLGAITLVSNTALFPQWKTAWHCHWIIHQQIDWYYVPTQTSYGPLWGSNVCRRVLVPYGLNLSLRYSLREPFHPGAT